MIGDFDSETVIKHLANKLDYPFSKLFGEFIKSCENMLIDPEVLSLVGKIRAKKIKVVVATDNMDSFDRWTSSSLNLKNHFDALLNSYNIKARKNDFDENGNSLFFGDYLSTHKLSPSETILIDDSEDKENLLSNYGVNCRKIEYGTGLKEELRNIL
ncbi:hypothetical protein A2803_04730 [Candidatus Woesebacteria bacterium RIFCSPHIGHO2_01_FULL_44_21]|uniref:FCP1 homology domain-containing protein n=1 Tax=Candidatus Woesebacteria bacterium RIFCSPHIGHO2_01_FULL_44_21 TaxID=1802503 RepID=A0A1F7Z1M8_9BACT|nr:MAG: hypothetical protein A2803_04730 [Candidatus Woesebacteria bacterium RIFCSPHIGHO2_01_FULL_44_21]OGM69423.1 MAG: hypothetical protein A2897_03660 [Candidatus Woesebacteria bacterium RIFCSPLOWO2_01_FULL_44_24b]